jgi:hypothetical protein
MIRNGLDSFPWGTLTAFRRMYLSWVLRMCTRTNGNGTFSIDSIEWSGVA